jgi:hypothetical protein
MGYNTRNDEIRDNVVRMRRESTTRRAWNRAGSNARLSAERFTWFWRQDEFGAQKTTDSNA